MALVTNISQLMDRQSISNDVLTAPLRALQESHPDVDFTIYPSIADPNPDEAGCPVCHCATVGIREAVTRKTVRICREIISALKLASLVHANPNEVQLYNKIRYIDGLPIVMSQTMTLHDAEKQIDVGLMEIDDDNDLIIHDLVHDVDKHCPGVNCRDKRHSGCFPECSALVKNEGT